MIRKLFLFQEYPLRLSKYEQITKTRYFTRDVMTKTFKIGVRCNDDLIIIFAQLVI